MNNIKKIQALITAEDAAGVLLSALTCIRWGCGFTGSNGLLLVTLDEAHLFTDARYTTQSREEVTGATVHIAPGQLIDSLNTSGCMPDGEVILQAEHVSIAQHAQLLKRLGERNWLPKSRLLEAQMAVKSPAEINFIRKAQEITDAVFEEILSVLKPGTTEREIAAEITYQHLQRGATKMSFDPIVASGPNGALPHARPSDRKLQLGDLVVLDFGCFYNGYASDMTRTVAIGNPSEKAREVYHVVKTAQQNALDAASSQMTTKTLDSVARGIIEEAGYGSYFNHSLGHGVGLDIHEWPRVSWQVDDPLAENMVITIEPGVYIPGELGVRIEDMVVLKPDGCEVLGHTPKSLLIL
ncbi:MAG: aminopeptidase P family protein [Bacteroidota bacterium]